HLTLLPPATTHALSLHDALPIFRARVDEAVSHGARVLTGGKVQGACYEPTLLTDVPGDVAMSKEETFGPVATITIVGEEGWLVADRKSTRLNSSHGSISYAVFCL